MRRPEHVADDEVLAADFICAVDPATNKHFQLWGNDLIASIVRPGQPPHEIKSLDLEVRHQDLGQLLDVIRRVEAIKGRLPDEVQRLREKLITGQAVSPP